MKKNLFLLFLLAGIAIAAFVVFNPAPPAYNTEGDIPYSTFIQDVRNKMVAEVLIDGRAVEGLRHNGSRFSAYSPGDVTMIEDLLQNGVKIVVQRPLTQSTFMQVFYSWAPTFLLIGVLIYFMRKQLMGAGAQNNFGKSRAKLMTENQVKVRFNDVAGVEEAKQDVAELVDFLRAPGKYEALGGKIPRGVLMVGPPGTGKTLLARAIAGEAGVPFFSISGSDFVEMFVGVGASRVRDLFVQAKKQAPCIIFIDEIDAVGRQRSPGNVGGTEEREQTLNQLLVEMDGFSGNEGIIVIAATNRIDVLDKALLRPGRFDRQVQVSLPDIKGREQILRVHASHVPLADDVNLNDLARGTPGFSGAELANLINEGALFAARNNQREITMNDLDKARDKTIMGAEKRTMIMSREDLLMTAYHEAGHAIVGRLVPEHDPVYKVSIMPRGGALGITMFLPERDEYSASKDKLESQISSLFGGRAAEVLVYGKNKVTTGASNDIQRATQLARNMVTKWGLSDNLGPMDYGDNEGSYLGPQAKPMSEHMARMIDREIRLIVDNNYSRAETLLKGNIDILHAMAQALLDWETLDKHQIDELMQGRTITPPAPDLNQKQLADLA
ncbi:MAG: cell division protein FtsH [Proteobacteria bacterium ST_bin11]|nr:MAG: cell division protein FtsH [Proteobacteria bacterium ST_bin11]